MTDKGFIPGLPGLIAQSKREVLEAIHQASSKIGVDFEYLVNKAKIESSLNAEAEATGSTATGLFQFIERTWLGMVSEYGANHGLGQLAAKIKYRRDGTPYVTDPKTRNQILDLRKDARISSLLAAEYARENEQALRRALRREPSSTDLYIAHLMGANGASSFLKAMSQNRRTVAAHLFPQQAAANPGVFYKNGRPRSLGEIYATFSGKINEAVPASEKPIPTVKPAAPTILVEMSPTRSMPGYYTARTTAIPPKLSLFSVLALSAITPTQDEPDPMSRNLADKHRADTAESSAAPLT